jgi:hypothetical protein
VVLKDFGNTTRLQKTGINSHMPEIDIFTQFRKPNTPHELLFCKVQLEKTSLQHIITPSREK